MGNIGGVEVLVVLIVALIVLGPQRLPQAARQAGRALSEFRRVTSDFQNEVRDAINTEPGRIGDPPPRARPARPTPRDVTMPGDSMSPTDGRDGVSFS